MPRRQCLLAGPGCSDGGLAVPGTSRCRAHSRGWTKTPEMLARGGFYKTRSWQVRRARQLRDHPDCARCGQPANVADHIEPIGLGGDPFGPLQSLCTKCHNLKSSSEGGKAAKRNRKNRGPS